MYPTGMNGYENVYTADEQIIESPERDSIVFKDGAMTYEEHKARQQAIALKNKIYQITPPIFCVHLVLLKCAFLHSG